MTDRKAALAEIRSNIDRHGQHVYLVLGGNHPRFSYSIGLSPRVGYELIVGGSSYYSNQQITDAIDASATRLSASAAASETRRISLPFGNFSLRDVDDSWARELALGVFDYYDKPGIPLRQLVPSANARTIDVPDMSVPWSAKTHPVWRWMHEPWPFEIAEHSTVVTNLRALRGEAVTEGLRRREDAWEIFVDADPDVSQRDVHVVPLSTLLAHDPSLEPFARLPVGAGLKRNSHGEWVTRKPGAWRS